MRRLWLCVLMISLTTVLCACALRQNDGEKKDAAQLIWEEYRSLASCDMTAGVRWQNGEETADYTLHCLWRKNGTATVEILAPEELAGICAEYDGDALSLRYDGVSLAAGEDGESLSPARCLPEIMDAVCNGYVLQKGTEEVEGAQCLYLLLEGEDGGGAVQYAVWFGSGHVPVRAEVITAEHVAVEVAFQDFTAEEAGGAADSVSA